MAIALLDPFIFVLLMAVSLATINVNGIAEAPKWAKVFHSLLSSNFDIFLLQETHLSSDVQGKEWEKKWGDEVSWSPGSNRSAGVAVLVHPRSTAKLADFRTDLSGRVVTVKIDLDGKIFQVINVYAANNHSD